MELLTNVISFSLFVLLQACFINGVHYAFSGKKWRNEKMENKEAGNILWPLRQYLSKYISKWWQTPLWECVRCMSSVYGTLTYLLAVVVPFGLHWWTLPLLIFDVCILVTVNYIVYKKL